MGNAGRRILGIAQLVFFVFVMGSHILTFSIMMNVLTDHSSCTILYAAVGLLVSFVLTLPRRLEKLSHLSSVSFVSITGAVLAGMVGISPTKLQPGPVQLFSPSPTVHDACLAIANVVFAYAGHVAFFTMFSELQDLRDFPKALALLQMSEMILYTITAIVIYTYAGPDVKSPALNSAGRLFRKISYGIAIPTVRGLPITSQSSQWLTFVRLSSEGWLMPMLQSSSYMSACIEAPDQCIPAPFLLEWRGLPSAVCSGCFHGSLQREFLSSMMSWVLRSVLLKGLASGTSR